MFRKTRLRLVLLNAAVLLLILSLLSALLYLDMRQRLYHEVDEALNRSAAKLSSGADSSAADEDIESNRDADEKIVYLYWDANGQLAGQKPERALDENAASKLRDSSGERRIRTVKTGGARYRAITVPGRNAESPYASIVIARRLHDEEITLLLLLRDIVAGIAAGAVVSLAAGWFLAERALVPIRRSWDKQQQFVADASHELRTPTAAIHARTELLLRHPESTIEQESPHIALILRESKRLGKLVEDLLTLARSDSEQQQIHATAVSLDSIVVDVAEQFRWLAETKDVRIETEVARPLPVWGDEGRLRQLLIILLDNALKFTPAGGRIEVVARIQSHSAYLSVSDTGCGIAETELPRVFERFYRGDKVRSRAEGGTGLGLAIAKWIADSHRATIRIHSKVGTGTKAELHFPRKPPSTG